MNLKKWLPKSNWEIVEWAIIFLFGYFFKSAASNKLIFLKSVIKDTFHTRILENSHLIVLVLFVLYIVSKIFVRRAYDRIYSRDVFDNVCKHIFYKFLSGLNVENKFMKVSLFKVIDKQTEKPYLTMVGRYQTKRPLRQCRVPFKPEEGCIGMAYAASDHIHKSINEFNQSDPEKYFTESLQEFHLPPKKAKKLNDKACEFLCIPVKFFGDDEPWGILSIDSMKKSTFDVKKARDIEEELSSFRAALVL